MIIRDVNLEDTKRLLEIYSYYILNTAITFEYAVPTEEEFKARIIRINKDYPYLVAEEDGKVIGYVYADHYSTREAYSWCVECSIYIDKDIRGKGIGKKLLNALEEKLIKQNVVKIISCIASTDEENKYLSLASIRFHEALGFKRCGCLERVGFKFDRWWNIVIEDKDISAFPDIPKPFIPYSRLANCNK